MPRTSTVLAAIAVACALGVSWSRFTIASRKRTVQSAELIRSAPEGPGFSFKILERADLADREPSSLFIGTVYPHASGAYKNKSGSPPLHFHRYDDEEFVILEGTMGYVFEGKEGILRKGESAVLPAGLPHTFWNAEPDKLLSQKVRSINRSGKYSSVERFFEQFAAISYDHGGIDNVSPLQLLLTLKAGGVEIAAPYPVRLFLWHVVCPFGELLGYKGFYPEYVLP